MARNFDGFQERIKKEFLAHPVVTANRYCRWFQHGDFSVAHTRHFVQQFSVFSNLFLLAALNRVINADSLESARESKEILMNELGVIYRKRGTDQARAKEEARVAADEATDPALVSTEGTVEAGTFRFAAAHFEWLLKIGDVLGLGFADLGQRRHGTKSTLFFCDELFRLYGSADYNEAQGASFAVENWAAAGFWRELVDGLEVIKKRELPGLPLAFFTFHEKIEGQHREHTWDELRECYHHEKFDEEAFLRAGVEMLGGVKAFWDGLLADAIKAGEVEPVAV